MQDRSHFDEVEAFTVERYQQIYGVGRTTIYGLIKQGKLEARKLGGRTLITAASARALFESLPRISSVD